MKDFSITEVIQLIGQQFKTGILKVQRGKDIAEIHFVDGMIVHVYSNYRGSKDLIGEILVKAHLITVEQLERVLRIQKESLKYLGEIMVELQLLNKEDVLKVISTQVYETIYDLFWWEEGHFNFDLRLVEGYKKIPFALSTEQVLLNILRMVDEWSEIEKKIFSPHLVFKKVTRPEGTETESLSPQDYLKEKLTSEQELVYQLVDGTRGVQEIIDRSLLGKFNASETLLNLSEMGLIEVVGIRTPNLIRKVSRINFRASLPYAYYAIFLVFVFLVILSWRPNFFSFFSNSIIERVDVGFPDRFAEETHLQRIRNALEVYFLEKGNYPDRLEELLSVRLLQKRDLLYGQGMSYSYLPKDGKYLLRH